ncbi:Uncharacterised protein [uncultured archaeon]|nr:Uncharacterised protein [uncultured archaeon]
MIMITVMPARWHARMLSLTPSRGGSRNPTKPKNVKPVSAVPARVAKASTRNASANSARLSASMSALSAGVSATRLPFRSACVERLSTTSSAPLTYVVFSLVLDAPWRCVVAMYLVCESNGTSDTRGRVLSRDAVERLRAFAQRNKAVSVPSPTTSPVWRSTWALLQSTAHASSSRKAGLGARGGVALTGHARPSTYTCSTFIWFCVKVPVLSVQMTSTLPSVSTAESLRTMAFLPASTCTPSAREMVMTMGRPSGMAATACAMARRMRSERPRWLKSVPKTMMAMHRRRMKRLHFSMNAFKRALSGTSPSSVCESFSEMSPIWVRMPVANTSALAVPRTTSVSLNTRLNGVKWRASFRPSARFSAGTVSPVRMDSSTAKFCDSIKRASAFTRSPASKSRMSPGTTSLAAICLGCPSRKTRA